MKVSVDRSRCRGLALGLGVAPAASDFEERALIADPAGAVRSVRFV
jgi:hypothetical protein